MENVTPIYILKCSVCNEPIAYSDLVPIDGTVDQLVLKGLDGVPLKTNIHTHSGSPCVGGNLKIQNNS